MTDSTTFTRRGFLKFGMYSGLGICIAPWGQEALGALFDEKLLTPVRWDRATDKTSFRIDGVAKVCGKKVFAVDIRARDMPHWPQQQAYALLLRITVADRLHEGYDLSMLAPDLQPDKIVTAKDLARDKLVLPEFYGAEPFLETGKQALYLGQPVAMLIYNDFGRFNSAKNALQFNDKVIKLGTKVPFREYPPYAMLRYVRVAGDAPGAPDVYSSMKDTGIAGTYRKDKTVWPKEDRLGKLDERGMAYAAAIDQQLTAPPADWLVWSKKYATQGIEACAMEPDNTNGWYDTTNKTLHMVISSQSPQETAEGFAQMLSKSKFGVKKMFVHPCETVGYGTKDSSIFPMYGLIAAIYGDARPVRLTNDRYEQFQSTMKRHPFRFHQNIAVDRTTGKFQILRCSMTSDGGGRANVSASVAAVAATGVQGVYYFPRNDIDVVSNYSRAVESGSMRGYGALEAMISTELMVDEIAHELGMDAIDLRLKNAFRSGQMNTQGIAPVGVERISEVLGKAKNHPLWQNRQAAKLAFESKHPGRRYGVGFGCAMKDFGCGAEASFARVELDSHGRIALHHSGTEMGTGFSTSQAVNCARWLGSPAETVRTALMEWPELPLKSTGDPFTMSQADQNRLSLDPLWTPRLNASSSASNSSYFSSHSTLEACRLIFLHGLWPAALSLWGRGIEGGMASSYVVRREDARWTPAGLTADGLEPLPLEQLARIAHEKGFITGAMVHSFNRWQWAEGVYAINGKPERAPVDGLSLRRGAGKFAVAPRQQVFYPKTLRNNAGVTYYSTVATLVALSVEVRSGEVGIIDMHHIVDCGRPIVPELVYGQVQGGVAMGIGQALYESYPQYEDGPGNGTWNFAQYHLPRASEVSVWKQTTEILKPMSETDPSKGIAEVVQIPVGPAILTAIHHATGARFYDLPVTAAQIKEKLA